MIAAVPPEFRDAVFGPDYAVVAYIRDGRFVAVASVLAVLHARGLIVAGKSGTVRHSESVTVPPEGLERRVWSAIHGFVSPGALMARPTVDAALNDLRRRACRLGLVHRLVPVRVFLPARTRAGRRALEFAFADYPWPPSPDVPEGPVEQRVGIAVALYGDAALNWADPQAPGPTDRYV
jgi:hypothetical protein